MKMIPVSEPCLGEDELKNVIDAVKSGWISSKGRFIHEFERKFSKYCGIRYGVATSNGTVALHLALEALGTGRGDEVIVPDFAFIAVANSVIYTGAKPVLVDSHPEYWCVDPRKIEEKITPQTKAIIPVHLYGHPCDMGAIKDIANDRNLFVVEDCAEAHGAEYGGKKVGSFGDVSCYSFYGNKIITTGEGGMCLTDNEELAERMRILKDHGMNPKKKYWHDVIGFNFRMTNLQAAVGVAQVKRIREFVEKKRKIAEWYTRELKDLKEKGLVELHPEMSLAKCVYWMYSILLTNKQKIGRDELMKMLGEKRIETRPFFFPIHEMPPYKIEGERFPVSEDLSRRGINLPSGVKLRKEDVLKVVGTIDSLLSG